MYGNNMNQLKKFQSFKQRLQLGKYKFHIVQQSMRQRELLPVTSTTTNL